MNALGLLIPRGALWRGARRRRRSGRGRHDALALELMPAGATETVAGRLGLATPGA